MAELSEWEVQKYKRQIQIPGLGEEGQEKLKAASVLVTRVGGLGGPTALWLAAAGVGRIVIAHDGVVTPSNLNRMILVRGDGVGRPRVAQMKETLQRFNPDLEVVAVGENATPENVAELVAQADVVCDTTPHFSERLLLNRECWRQGTPMVDAGMNGMEAQLTTIIPPDSPCLACRVPEVPKWWDPLGFGVLGAVSGSLGALAAVEVVKVLTGFGQPLVGRLLSYDTEDMTFHVYSIRKRPGCEVCG